MPEFEREIKIKQPNLKRGRIQKSVASRSDF